MTGPGWVLGVDSGGSGLRLALARAGSTPGAGADVGPPVPVGSVSSDDPVRTGPAGIDAGDMLARLVPAARGLLARAGAPEDGLRAVCVGAAGMASLGTALRAELPGALTAAFGTDVRRIALAADAVTAYAGALGQRPGAVLAAGTGMIATGTDLRTWRRADGWGHLLGDCGGGAWIGRAGLEAALRAYDGRAGGSGALREQAEEMFGRPLSALAGQLYPRTDRAAVLASFAPRVAACAEHDAVAGTVLREAAHQMAVSAAAVCPDGARDGSVIALTGGLFRLGEVLCRPLREELARRVPGARTAEARGGPLEGSLLVADQLAAGALRLPTDPTLLLSG
ncbi:BadF/BadG/BcrA/BcrD ATPase family protein [Streptomyces sp. HNM0574]|uniref:N-acetylglucosamine kinase n=1 Tax=Streptomyces sp. HNM0574 TaxID=2714954 RepID=UPI0032163FCA